MLRSVLKQIFSSGQRITHPTGPVKKEASLEKPSKPHPLDELIDYAALLCTDVLPVETDRRVSKFCEIFSTKKAARQSTLNVFLYHADMGDAGKLDYRDIKMDTTRFDYCAVLQAFVASIRRWHPDANIFLATSKDSTFDELASAGVHVVPLDINPGQPMYERVCAMYAYTHSDAFDADTLLLDSDAFLNSNIGTYLEIDSDVAVTFRDVRGFMPVNEGVIFAKATNLEAVRLFFRRYLATYESLSNDARVNAFYGDIRKWRGGQLSLNAITRNAAPFSPYRILFLDGVRLQTWPCDPFNFSYEYGQNVGPEQLSSKVVVHLKGSRKNSLDIWNNYLAHSKHGNVSGSDRRLSLDTTYPQDYDPPENLDFGVASLTDIADHFKTDKGRIKHNYTDIYSKYFEELRKCSPFGLLEIGVACGSSLKMWSCYFGPASRIVGIDIRSECATLCGRYTNIDILIGDASTISISEEFNAIIDDGSHVSEDIVRNWSNLWRSVKPSGYYIVEDVRCTHDKRYKEIFSFTKEPSSFDRQHVVGWLDGIMRKMDFSMSDVEFIHIYRELIIMKKSDR